MDDEYVQPRSENHLVDHFYRETDLVELERLMMVIAEAPMRADNILHSAGFLERMMVHIIHQMLVDAYGPDGPRKFGPTESVRAIAAKVRVNFLMHHALETGVDDLIAGVYDPVIRQNFVEPIAAHAITIVAVAQKIHAEQPVGSQELPSHPNRPNQKSDAQSIEKED